VFISDRKSAIAGSNAQAVSKYGKSLDAEAASLSMHLQEFVNMHNQLNTKLRVSAQQFQTAESEVKFHFKIRIGAVVTNGSLPVDSHGAVEYDGWPAP
jgi:hypothetical protein